MDFEWGAVVNFMRKENPQNNPTNSVPVYVIDILLHVSTESANVCLATNRIINAYGKACIFPNYFLNWYNRQLQPQTLSLPRMEIQGK